MARFAYFADQQNGSSLEWTDRRERVGEDRYGAPRYRDVPARVTLIGNEWFGILDGGHKVRITRVVELKANPSRHECDDRCMNATGRVMKCECACGGKNHGRGAVFTCEAA